MLLLKSMMVVVPVQDAWIQMPVTGPSMHLLMELVTTTMQPFINVVVMIPTLTLLMQMSSTKFLPLVCTIRMNVPWVLPIVILKLFVQTQLVLLAASIVLALLDSLVMDSLVKTLMSADWVWTIVLKMSPNMGNRMQHALTHRVVLRASVLLSDFPVMGIKLLV